MNIRFSLFPFMLLAFCNCLAQAVIMQQVTPAPGDKLNYTQIMFDHPSVKRAGEYVVEVTLAGPDASFQHPVAISKDSSTATMISHFEFGKKYIWRFTGLSRGKQLGWNGPYNFEILNCNGVDGKLFRVEVLENDTTANAGGLIIMDVPRTIVDRHGNFVWFLPPDTGNTEYAHAAIIKAANPLGAQVNNPGRGAAGRGRVSLSTNDMRFTAQGTITLLTTGLAEEVDIKGNLIWQAPPRLDRGAAGSMDYNHCFKKMSNGHYMVIDAGNPKEFVSELRQENVPGNPRAPRETGNDIAYEIIKEFDEKGKVLWSWSSENYFDSAELRSMLLSKPDAGLLNPTPGGHMNAFDVDENNAFVYAGFRNVSRVIKIDKATGKVICAWGDNMIYNGGPNANGFFEKQHETSLLRNGNIAVFSNGNFQREDVTPGRASVANSAVVVFTQPLDTVNSRIAWKFDCRFDSSQNFSLRGGSVDELKNGNFLVGMGAVNRIFEITPDKRIVWNALLEKYNSEDSTWQPYGLYRAHYTSSLYPCYFTIQSNAEELNDKLPVFRIRIFNDGTESDSYQVKVSSKTGAYQKDFTTAVLPGRKSTGFQIAPENLPAIADTIKVSVTSVNNPGLLHSFYIKYEK